ncbi:MAG: PEGA domain-containing protein, partial [Phycisphaerales bacterium]
PTGALVLLNEEEIGVSPVTVGFEWYGDYNIRLSKENYQTLVTHQSLQRPLRDSFPFDLFDDMFRTRIDEYSWNFKLEPLVQPTKEELIEKAVNLRKEALVDPNAIAPKGLKPYKPKVSKPKAEKKKVEKLQTEKKK